MARWLARPLPRKQGGSGQRQGLPLATWIWLTHLEPMSSFLPTGAMGVRLPHQSALGDCHHSSLGRQGPQENEPHPKFLWGLRLRQKVSEIHSTQKSFS